MAGNPPVLQKYDVKQIALISGEIARFYRSGDLDAAALAAHLQELKFRDDSNGDWAIAPLSGQWYRWENGGWRSASPPIGMLEGLAALTLWGAKTPLRDPVPSAAEASGQTWDAVTELADASCDLFEAYHRGELTSAMLAFSLRRLYLFDDQHCFWGYCPRLRQWFAFKGENWQPQAGPPDARHIVQPGVDDADAICSFLNKGAQVLPAPVVTPWRPPPGYPEPVHSTKRAHPSAPPAPANGRGRFWKYVAIILVAVAILAAAIFLPDWKGENRTSTPPVSHSPANGEAAQLKQIMETLNVTEEEAREILYSLEPGEVPGFIESLREGDADR